MDDVDSASSVEGSFTLVFPTVADAPILEIPAQQPATAEESNVSRDHFSTLTVVSSPSRRSKRKRRPSLEEFDANSTTSSPRKRARRTDSTSSLEKENACPPSIDSYFRPISMANDGQTPAASSEPAPAKQKRTRKTSSDIPTDAVPLEGNGGNQTVRRMRTRGRKPKNVAVPNSTPPHPTSESSDAPISQSSADAPSSQQTVASEQSVPSPASPENLGSPSLLPDFTEAPPAPDNCDNSPVLVESPPAGKRRGRPSKKHTTAVPTTNEPDDHTVVDSSAIAVPTPLAAADHPQPPANPIADPLDHMPVSISAPPKPATGHPLLGVHEFFLTPSEKVRARQLRQQVHSQEERQRNAEATAVLHAGKPAHPFLLPRPAPSGDRRTAQAPLPIGGSAVVCVECPLFPPAAIFHVNCEVSPSLAIPDRYVIRIPRPLPPAVAVVPRSTIPYSPLLARHVDTATPQAALVDSQRATETALAEQLATAASLWCRATGADTAGVPPFMADIVRSTSTHPSDILWSAKYLPLAVAELFGPRAGRVDTPRHRRREPRDETDPVAFLDAWLAAWRRRLQPDVDMAQGPTTLQPPKKQKPAKRKKPPPASNGQAVLTFVPVGGVSTPSTPSAAPETAPPAPTIELHRLTICESDSTLSSLYTAVLLIGPVGSGKTAAVYTMATHHGFHVLEVNSSTKRTGRMVQEMFGEATQSRHVTGMTSAAAAESDAAPLPAAKVSTSTLLLFEEVDVVFSEDERGFLAALVALVRDAKCPIVLTANARPPPGSLNSLDDLIHLPHVRVLAVDRPPVCRLVPFGLAVLAAEDAMADTADVELFAELMRADTRHFLNTLQLWADGRGLLRYVPCIAEKSVGLAVSAKYGGLAGLFGGSGEPMADIAVVAEQCAATLDVSVAFTTCTHLLASVDIASSPHRIIGVLETQARLAEAISAIDVATPSAYAAAAHSPRLPWEQCEAELVGKATALCYAAAAAAAPNRGPLTAATILGVDERRRTERHISTARRQAVKSAASKIAPPFAQTSRDQLWTDFVPFIRKMAQSENTRRQAQTKRRFHHYFDSMPLSQEELESLES